MATRWLLILAVAAGCIPRTMNHALAAKDTEGMGRVYDKPCLGIWPVAIFALRDAGATVIEQHRDEGYMLSGAGGGSVGFTNYDQRYIVAWLDPKDGGSRCLLTIVIMYGPASDEASRLSDMAFHQTVRSQLGLSVDPTLEPRYNAATR